MLNPKGVLCKLCVKCKIHFKRNVKSGIIPDMHKNTCDAASYLTDSLTGILKEDYNLNEAKAERLQEKYGSID